MPPPKLKKKNVMESPTVSKLIGRAHHKHAAPMGRQLGLKHVMRSGGCLALELG